MTKFLWICVNKGKKVNIRILIGILLWYLKCEKIVGYVMKGVLFVKDTQLLLWINVLYLLLFTGSLEMC